jgi:hypothetical protein
VIVRAEATMRHSLVTISLLNQARAAADAFEEEEEDGRELSPAAARLLSALEPRPRRFAGHRARRARRPRDRTLSLRA